MNNQRFDNFEKNLQALVKEVHDLANTVTNHLIMCEKRLVPLETKVRIICWIAGIVVTVGLGAILKGCGGI